VHVRCTNANLQKTEPSRQASTRQGWHSGEMMDWDSEAVQQLAQVRCACVHV